MYFDYFIPTKILLGNGKLDELHLHTMPGKKALIVTSCGGSVKKYGYLDRLIHQLDLSGTEYALFDKILPNPISAHVMEGAAVVKAENCDFVIGFGGGSSMDSAKSIAFMATNDGDYWDYIEGGSGKNQPPQKDPLPIIAITTTAGTGTEADPWTVITKGNEKIGFGYDKTFPVLSVVDPELMLSVPAHLTAYQGFDALFHSTEGYVNKRANMMSDLFAEKAISLIGKHLTDAVQDGNNLDARAGVALANTLSGMVESLSGCTAEHSMEHSLSGFHPNLPHGAGLIIISAEYYSFLAASCKCDEKLVKMARLLGMEDAARPEDFVTALTGLQKACGVAGLRLSEYGVTADELEAVANGAHDTMGGLYNVDPSDISRADTLGILKRSYR